MFKVLDYLDKLDIIKETDTHLTCHCPVCGDDNFKIKKTGRHKGAYACWSHRCGNEEIRESLGYKDSVFSVPKLRETPPKPTKVPFRGTKLLLTEDYEPIEPSVRAYIGDYTTETREYPYAHNQRVLRIDNISTDTKYVFIQYLNDDFVWVNGSGPNFWPVYDRGINFNQPFADSLLFVEGEKTAEFVKERGIAAITLMSGNFNEKMAKNLLILKNTYANIKNIVYMPDHDKAGYTKAEKVQESCWRVGLGCRILTMPQVSDNPFDGMDLADCTEKEFTIFKNNVTGRKRTSVVS